MHRYEGLVFDLGASEGNDTAFYLQKGFRVVAVEADPAMCEKLRTRFAVELEAGALKLFSRAASGTSDRSIEFFICEVNQGVSGVAINPDVKEHYKHSCMVRTIDWRTLLSEGRPYYVKIDIEGHETEFLSGMSKNDKPEFISVECHDLSPAQRLYDLGYRRFKLVDQNCQLPDANSRSGFRLADTQLEGSQVSVPNFHHASGPFGLDVFGYCDWMDYSKFEECFYKSQHKRDHTWFDCHAWHPRPRTMFRLARHVGIRRLISSKAT